MPHGVAGHRSLPVGSRLEEGSLHLGDSQGVPVGSLLAGSLPVDSLPVVGTRPVVGSLPVGMLRRHKSFSVAVERLQSSVPDLQR